MEEKTNESIIRRENQKEETTLNDMRKEHGLSPIPEGDIAFTEAEPDKRRKRKKLAKPIVKDLKEYAPCGMKIHYTMESETVVTYTDINGRGKNRYCEACEKCSWRAICQPTECNYMAIIQEYLGRAVNPLDVIIQLYEKAAAGYEAETIYGGNGAIVRVKKEPYRWKNGGIENNE